MKKMGWDVFLINGLLFLLPLVYVSGLGSFGSMRYFFFATTTLVLAVLTTLKFLKNKWLWESFYKSWYCYGLIAYLLAYILVSFTSIDPALSFWSSFQKTNGVFTLIFLSFFAMSVYGVAMINGRRALEQFLASSVLGAVILSLVILFSTEGFSLIHWKWLAKSNGGGMIGNSSIAASYVLWNIFFAVILFIRSNFIKQKILWVSSFLLLSFSPLFFNWHVLLGDKKYENLLSLIGSARGPVMGIVFGIIVFIGVWLVLQSDKIKKYIGALLLGVLLFGTVYTGVVLLDKSSTLHLKFIENVGENRFFFWDASLAEFKQHPVLGIGPNNFSYALHNHFNAKMLLPQNGEEVLTERAHNLFFETLVGGGILLVVALFFFLMTIVYSLIKLRLKDKFLNVELSLFIGAFFAWLLQAQFVFESIGSLAMLFLVCSIAYGSSIEVEDSKKQQTHTLSSSDKFILGLSSVVVVALFILAVFLPYAKTKAMNKTYNTQLPARALLWKNLANISPMGNSNDSVTMFNNIFLSYDREKQNIQSWDENKKIVVLKEIDEIIDYLTKINTTDDYNLNLVTIKIAYVRMYISKDISTPLFEQTEKVIERMILFSPSDPQPLWTKAQLAMAKSNLGEAKEILEKALVLQPNLLYTHILILQLARVMKDQAYFNTAFERAKVDVPNFLDLIEQG